MAKPYGPYPQPINIKEADYIFNNYKTTTVIVMAKHLSRGLKTVYDFMDENNLEVFRTGPGRTRTVFNRYFKPQEVY